VTVKIYALGDSITYGFPYGPRHSWVHMVSRRTGLSLINGGSNGDTTSYMVQRLGEALTQKPSHILYLGGTNDAYWGHSPLAVARNAAEISRRCHEGGVRLILGLPIPVDEPGAEALLAQYRHGYRELAAREALGVIPFVDAFLDQHGRFMSELTTDGCHPNIDGYEAMADLAERFLPKLLRPENP
jgi:acyl-CoA thioesterase I